MNTDASGEMNPFSHPPAADAPRGWRRVGDIAIVIVNVLLILTIAVAAASLVAAYGLQSDYLRRDLHFSGSVQTYAMAGMQVAMILATLIIARISGPFAMSLAWRRPELTATDIGKIVAVLVAFVAASTAFGFLVVPEVMKKDLATFEPLLLSDAWPLALAVMVIGAPVSEELIFRGYMLPAMTRSGAPFWPTAIVATLLWTALHAGYSAIGLAEVFLAGIMLSWVLRLSNSVIAPIIVHAAFNAIAVCVLISVLQL